MKCATKVFVVIGIALFASNALAVSYIWIGADSSLWPDCGNWRMLDEGPYCYPHDTAATAMFLNTGTDYSVQLVGSEMIDNLVINGNVHFAPQGSGGPIRMLSADTVSITGQSGGTTVSMSGGGLAQIWTQ